MGGQSCVCKNGYSGKNCDTPPTPTNPCLANNPCKNNGKCTYSTAWGQGCDCINGWRGEFCERPPLTTTAPDPCIANIGYNPCKNNGKCVYSTQWGQSCECINGWRGETCDRPPIDDPCQTNNGGCQNGTPCVNNNGVATCECGEYWKGAKCDEPKICATLYTNNGGCLNGSKCKLGIDYIIGDYKPVCECVNGYTGDKCEISPNPCNSNNGGCLNGSTCEFCQVCGTNGEATCQCVNGFTGDKCQNAPPTADPRLQYHAACTATFTDGNDEGYESRYPARNAVDGIYKAGLGGYGTCNYGTAYSFTDGVELVVKLDKSYNIDKVEIWPGYAHPNYSRDLIVKVGHATCTLAPGMTSKQVTDNISKYLNQLASFPPAGVMYSCNGRVSSDTITITHPDNRVGISMNEVVPYENGNKS